MRVRIQREMTAEQFVVISRWLLDHFDFEHGRIVLNDREDIEITRGQLELQSRAHVRGKLNMLRTFYFADDELGLLFRMKFA